MKWIIVTVILGLGILCAWSICHSLTGSNDGKTAAEISWNGPYAVRVPGGEVLPDSQGGHSLKITPRLENNAPFEAVLFRIANPPVRYRFALIGTISYTNLPDNAVLQLSARYLVKTATVTTSEDEGPQGHLFGSSQQRPFIMTIAELPGNGKLLQLELSAFFAGHIDEDATTKGQPPSLTLSDLKLVAYPDPTAEDLGLAPPAASGTGGLLDWKSFCAGAAAAAILALAFAQGVVLVRRLRKLRDEQEMRQIASLDG